MILSNNGIAFFATEPEPAKISQNVPEQDVWRVSQNTEASSFDIKVLKI